MIDCGICGAFRGEILRGAVMRDGVFVDTLLLAGAGVLIERGEIRVIDRIAADGEARNFFVTSGCGNRAIVEPGDSLRRGGIDLTWLAALE